MADWNSALYLKFRSQRTQPAIDLARRVGDYAVDPSEVIDLGCGPGNSTQVLEDQFPCAHITGANKIGKYLLVHKAGYTSAKQR